MPSSRVLVCDPISEDAERILRQSRKIDLSYEPEISQTKLLDTVNSYDALIVRSRTKVTKEVIARAERLKVIGRAGVGIDNIDATATSERGIKILNTPDALTNAVAEFTMGLMLNLARRINRADVSVHQGQWLKSSFQGIELNGRTYGTIGMGRIGQRVSELAYAFGMKIIANDVIPIPAPIVDRCKINIVAQEKVFEEADYVDLHVPLTAQTTHLVNYEKLLMMKRTAFLINTSRGKVVDENALLKALNESTIAGAALDVFEIEPPA
ncbi:MAG: hydroxyacid dehydrogenase, partial [Nitrososphaerales archaeon]